MFDNDIIGNSRNDEGKVDDTRVRLFAEGVPPGKEIPDALRALVATGGENDTPRTSATSTRTCVPKAARNTAT